jgi:hypothetical protein
VSFLKAVLSGHRWRAAACGHVAFQLLSKGAALGWHWEELQMAKHWGHDDDNSNDGNDDFVVVVSDDNGNGEHRGHEDGNGEHRGHEDGNDDGFVHRFGVVDANATDPAHPGQMYFGNGNLATGYNIADNAQEHVEVALKVHPRGGPDQTPTFDSHGNPTYTEAAGLQDATPGHERANWNFDFSADTALGGGNHNLNQYDFKITVANATHTETFDLAKGNSHVWVSEQDPSHAFGGDDFNHPATAAVMASEAENSVNVAFHAFDSFGPLAARVAAGQHYEVTLQAFEHHEQIAAVHDFIVVA